MAWVRALRVCPGDRVESRGEWREVTAVHSGRFALGAPLVLLVFRSGPSLRVPAAEVLTVESGGRGSQ